MEILSHEAAELKDPTGIMPDKRYEFLLDIEVDEEDELYTENGLTLRLILAADGQNLRIIQYFFIEKTDGRVLEFALEEEEEQQVLEYCRVHMAGDVQ